VVRVVARVAAGREVNRTAASVDLSAAREPQRRRGTRQIGIHAGQAQALPGRQYTSGKGRDIFFLAYLDLLWGWNALPSSVGPGTE